MLKTIRIFFLFTLPLFLNASVFDWLAPVSDKARRAQDLLENFDEVVEKAMKEFEVPGMSIGIVVDGHVVYAKGFGYRDLENKLPVTPDTLFPIGSCTKGFTSFVVGNLIDEGLLNWDEMVLNVLPEFRLWDQYATQNLTIRDLLTHRSGLPRHDFMWYNSTASRAELIKRIRYLEPSVDIRERYQYNNLMYLTAGCAMEQITGKTFEEIVREKILIPLEMNHTNFSIIETQNSGNFASPYIEKNDKLKKIPYRDISVMGPIGSLNSNVTDLIHWLQVHLNQGVYNKTTLISPTTLQEIHAPQVIVPGAPESKESLLYAYGIGWGIVSYRGKYLLSHDGGIDGFTNCVGFLPNEGIGFVIQSNRNLTSLPRYLSFEILDRLLELPLLTWLKDGAEGIRKNKESMKENMAKEDMLQKKGTHPSHPLEEFVGTYEHPGYGKLTIELVNGKLNATYNGITSILDHYHYDVFFISQETQDLFVSLKGTKFTFRNNINGDIDELSLPLEPTTNDIVFKRKAEGKLTTLSYLKQFVGAYEIYGYTVEIVIRDNVLCAVIPSQPIFELVPLGENEFTVKGMLGSSVRFVLNAMNKVDEVLLVHPYGTFTAKPKQ